MSRNIDIIGTLHLEGCMAAIGRHREKLDRRLHRKIGDRDFEMSNSLVNKNLEITICDFAI
jgi:hypothetical protein